MIGALIACDTGLMRSFQFGDDHSKKQMKSYGDAMKITAMSHIDNSISSSLG